VALLPGKAKEPHSKRVIGLQRPEFNERISLSVKKQRQLPGERLAQERNFT
jgi:hypothetical protein